ncbi:ParB family protein [Klebsiella pneumoniae]|jgi:ParB family chromosome partitioning protein|uniref:ParB family protein n=1 Tax=Klebsiella TaxID=570 RepID=UPI0018C6F598|nr:MULTISPECIES: ParB family protein [Klebsiella]HCC2750473.1 peptide transporter [Klebsiella quasipneumoniae]HDT5900288.1 peptide transporter [Raoultella ornithinolytica]MBD7347614.1 peptide transporter [Klebsiella pneumoniae]MBD7357919.1 peptide transporter [Klebsiella pneumoniae]MBD7369088.1 peptide transporter [Klebsiella pneumoniae]
MSDVERGTSKDKYLTGNVKRTFVDQKSGLPPLKAPSVQKRLFTLSNGRKVEARYVVIPGSEVAEKTLVHELNPRNQEAIDDLSTRDILPLIKENGVTTEAIAVYRDGKYYLIEGSRRRYCCIKCLVDLPLWAFDEEVSPADVDCIVNAAQTAKRFSYREVGIKYLQIMKNEEFKTNEELASYFNISVESIRKRIQAAKVNEELIRIFPDSEGIPNTYYGKLAKIEKIAKTNKIPLSELTSEVGTEDNKNINVNDIEEVQKSILDGLHSVLTILCNDANKPPKWTVSDIVDFENKDTYARVRKSNDGQKVSFEFKRISQTTINEIERLIKVSIGKSK